MSVCQHPESERGEGPRFPLRWGSSATDVCKCGAYRLTLHKVGPWVAGPIEQAIEEVLDERDL